MPSIHNYEKKTAKKAKHEAVAPVKKHTTHKPRRRPGREQEVKADMGNSENAQGKKHENVQAESILSEEHKEQEQQSQTGPERKKVQIEFYGSEIIKAKAPKAFELAENVAEEWINDGDFKSIPIEHPLAQQVASLGLQKAKTLEKKLEEKGVFMIAKMGIELAKSKLKK